MHIKHVLIIGGKTIAVIAGGLDYASKNEKTEIYYDILDSGGCIISEYEDENVIYVYYKSKEDDTLPDSKFYRKRNRIISGLAKGTLVIEASYISGARITAGFCKEQKKPLFCIPNAIGSKNSAGINMLLKQGAHFTTCVEDIIDILGGKEEILNNITIEGHLSEKELIIYKTLKDSPKFIDEIENITKIQINELNALISMMELNDYIIKLSNNKYAVK